MALFAGVWQRNGSRLSDRIATDMLAALHAPYHEVLSAIEDGALAIVGRSLSAAPIVSHSGIIAALSGRLDGGLQAEDVLDAYMGKAHDAFQDVTGDYAIAVFDPGRHTLMLLRDAIGTQPLYYHVGEDGSFAFGSQIKAILAATNLRPQPNRAALAQLLVAGTGIPHGQTCFEGVYALPPGQALFVTPDSISNATHVDLRPIAATPLRSFDESATAFRRTFLNSVSRRIEPNRTNAVFLSGGVDSSAITAAAARTAGPQNIVAISYGTADGGPADETRFVDAVVEKTGVRSMRLPLQPIGFPSGLEADAWTNEVPLCDDIPDTLARAAAAARSQKARRVFMGIFGDQVLFPFPPPYLYELLKKGRLREYGRIAGVLPGWISDVPAREVRQALRKQLLRTVIPAAMLDRFRPARATYADALDRLALLAQPRRRAPLTHAATVRHEITNPRAVNAAESITKWGWTHGVEVQLPFLDADLAQLLMAVPAEHGLHEGVPKALLRTGLSALLPEAISGRTDKGDYGDAISSEMQRNHDDCLEALDGCQAMVEHGIMSRGAAANTLARFKHANDIEAGGAALLPMLAGVNAWLKVFFDVRRDHA